MFTSITHSFVYVLDQDEALDFYVGKLGMEVVTDVELDFMRWLTICVPGEPHREIVLTSPDNPFTDEDSATRIRELLSKGMLTGFILATDDCRATYEKLSARGVEFTQEPTERVYGIDCALRDPFGNQIRITEPAERPVGTATDAQGPPG